MSCGEPRRPDVAAPAAAPSGAVVDAASVIADSAVTDAAPAPGPLTEIGSAKLSGWATVPVFTPDGAEVCLLQKGVTLRCFDASTLQEVNKPGGTITRATDAMVVIDGASAFDAKTGAELKFPPPKARGCESAFFSRDGSKLLANCSGSRDEAVLWERPRTPSCSTRAATR